LPKFLEILPKFSTNQNFWGCACTPCTPVSYTSVLHYVSQKSNSFPYFIIS